MRSAIIISLVLALAAIAFAQAPTTPTYTPTVKFTAGAKRTYTGSFTWTVDNNPSTLKVTMRETVSSCKDNRAVVLWQRLCSQEQQAETTTNGGAVMTFGGMQNEMQADTSLLRNTYGSSAATDPRSKTATGLPPVDGPKTKLVEYYDFEGMSIAFPAKAIKVGDSWSSAGTIVKQSTWTGIYFPIPYTAKYTLTEAKQEKGHTLLTIKCDVAAKLAQGNQQSLYEFEGGSMNRSAYFGLDWTLQATTVFDLEAGEIASVSIDSKRTEYTMGKGNAVTTHVSTKKGSLVRDPKADSREIDPADPWQPHMATD